MEMFEKALKFRQQQGDEPQIQIAKWCVARCLRSLGRVDEALAVQRVLEQNGEGMYVYEEIAECLLLLKREAEARPYFARRTKCYRKTRGWPKTNRRDWRG